MGLSVNPLVSKQQIKAAAATLPAPVDATSGVAVTAFKLGDGPEKASAALIALFSAAGDTVNDAKLYAYGPFGASGANSWFLAGELNGGDPIVLTTAIGFCQTMAIPGAFTRLCVGGTIVGANTVGYSITPLQGV